MNESQNYVKSCFGIQWRNDKETIEEGYYWEEQLQGRSWLLDWRIRIISDTAFPDSPNLSES